MISLNKLLIDDIDYSEYAVWTLQGQNTLDESLDMQYIELKGTPYENPLKPFANVTIEIKDNLKTFTKTMLVESDTVTEVISNGLYNHNLLFIEETKWLERLFVEKTVRQPLIHDYTIINADVNVNANITGTSAISTIPIPTTDEKNGMVKIFPSIFAIGKKYNLLNPVYMINEIQKALNIYMYVTPYWLGTNLDVKLTITDIVNNNVVFELNKHFGQESIPDDTFEFTPSVSTYKFTITVNGNTFDFVNIDGKAEFLVTAIPNVEPKDDYTIKDVVNQLLSTCITLRENETPLFALAEPDDYENVSDAYKEKIKNIHNSVSPEFTFSKMSLFEALQTIGDYAHFIPRMNNKKIYFDLLGDNEITDVESLGDYYSNVSNLASNNFCNALDSQVNNLTNMDDEAQGSVSTPDKSGYRTVRMESGNAQLKEGEVIFPTEDNIEKIIKLEIGYLSDNETLVGDITPFVYEEDEYNTLSSYADTFPTSKACAIKYKQGTPNITALGFKQENPVSAVFENYAIENIMFKKLNKSTSWWNNVWNDTDILKLQYRLTYIPSTNTRITQFKTNKEDIDNKPLYIAYNQSASKVSSDAYGENLKGTIAKIGNIEKTKMYLLPSFELMPKCGTLFDKDYYISVVKYEVYPNFIKCELGLSKNFNNKSAYVEINSQLEFFEYNRNITIDRYVVYEDYCEVGDYSEGDSDALITSQNQEPGLDLFASTFNFTGEDEAGRVIDINGSLNEWQYAKYIDNPYIIRTGYSDFYYVVRGSKPAYYDEDTSTQKYSQYHYMFNSSEVRDEEYQNITNEERTINIVATGLGSSAFQSKMTFYKLDAYLSEKMEEYFGLELFYGASDILSLNDKIIHYKEEGKTIKKKIKIVEGTKTFENYISPGTDLFNELNTGIQWLFEQGSITGYAGDRSFGVTAKFPIYNIKLESLEDDEADVPIGVVIAKGYDANNNELNEVMLPVISLGVGNSVLFSFHYADTIGAGSRVYSFDSGRYEDLVKYTDVYGEMETLKLDFSTSSQSSPSGYNEAVERGDKLPLKHGSLNPDIFFKTGDNKIVIKKGVGEAIHFTYQLHFVSNKPNLIIGSGLTRKSAFVSSEPKKMKIYVSTEALNKFETKIDLTKCVDCGKVSITGFDDEKKVVKIDDFTAPVYGEYKSWCIVQTYNNQNEFIIGENIDIKANQTVTMPVFSFKRRLK